ncbi:hypothetical protein ACV4Q3_004131 [Yersinia enterocolitica]
MSEIKQYDTEVRLEAVMGTNHYGVHIHAMTKEDLHSKSGIAVELAWRDLRIEQLVGETAALWNENSVPEVKLGHQMQCWAIVKRTGFHSGKVTVRVAMLRYLNKPFEEGDNEVDWALQDDNGDYYNAVGWHSYHDHPEYSDYYQKIEQEEEVLAWQPLVYPDLPEKFAASLRGK